jgi:acetyl-CoA decarbonylase/synthase complex subunit delta
VPASPAAPGVSVDNLSCVISVLDRVRNAGLPPPGVTPEEQLAALQMSTAVNLLTAGANMLLIYSGALGQVPAMPVVATVSAPAPAKEKPITTARIVAPLSFDLPADTASMAVREVTLGGSGTRTTALTIGGAAVFPFRHYEGRTGRSPAIAMEVFDKAPRNYPPVLRQIYGDLLVDPAKMAKYCVDELGAQAISVRLEGAHPDNGNASPESACDVIQSVLRSVGVPVIVTGPSHYEKNNAVMKVVASAFANENLLLNWVETDNYKTIVAAAMGYNHCVVTQTPIDVNMAKQLNILSTNMGLSPDKIVIDPMTGALGYGLEYSYSVMERIRGAALGGDGMLAMPMLVTPGYEVAKTKESKAPEEAFKLWGPESERGALLEIATAMSLLNAGADLLIMYQPAAVRVVKRKIIEMNRVEG